MSSLLAQKINIVWLDELDVTKIIQDRSKPHAKLNTRGGPISLGGKIYERGVGTHATGDIIDSWGSVYSIVQQMAQWPTYSCPGNWNDADMLVVGWMGGWHGEPHASRLTPSEQYTHISLWAMFASPLLLGCDVNKLDDFTLNLLTNDEVIAINQDPLGQGAERIFQDGLIEIWKKDLADGSLAVALCNFKLHPTNIRIDWDLINLNSECTVRDVWRQKNLGKYDNHFSGNVTGHGTLLLKIIKTDEFRTPQLAPEWNFMNNPDSSLWELNNQKGVLILNGNQNNLDSLKQKALILQRQKNYFFEVETKLSFSPGSENHEAGITAFMARDYHYDFFVTKRKDKKVVVVRRKIDDINFEEITVPVKNQSISLKISGDPWQYKFSFQDGDTLKELITLKNWFITIHTVGEYYTGFTGMYLGLFVIGYGNHAEFDYFSYREIPNDLKKFRIAKFWKEIK